MHLVGEEVAFVGNMMTVLAQPAPAVRAPAVHRASEKRSLVRLQRLEDRNQVPGQWRVCSRSASYGAFDA